MPVVQVKMRDVVSSLANILSTHAYTVGMQQGLPPVVKHHMQALATEAHRQLPLNAPSTPLQAGTSYAVLSQVSKRYCWL